MTTNAPGLLHQRTRYGLLVDIAAAKNLFARADHCQGHIPGAIVFHPTERPDADNIGGLAVLTAEDVLLHHLRIIGEAK